MKTWIISISAIVLLTSIFSLIIPESRIGKLIKNVFSILIVFVIISPLSNLKTKNLSFESFVNTSEITFQNDYLNYIGDKKATELKNECIKIIEKLGVNNVFVKICYNYDSSKNFIVEYAQINLKNAVIISDKEHINIKEEIRNALSSYLQIDKNNVLINE